MVSIEERIKQKAKKNLDLQILKCAKPLLDFISRELSGNPSLPIFLKNVQIIEENISVELTEKAIQKAIDSFVGYTESTPDKDDDDDDDDDDKDDDDENEGLHPIGCPPYKKKRQ